MAAGSEVDLREDISMRPEKKVVKELNRYEDPDDPLRPTPPPRPRAGLWAPPGPQAIEPPEVLIVGLGRQLRGNEAQGPRARLGAGALEALQHRYGIRTFFDTDVRGYMGTCKASLDKSGRAGVQTIHLLQPLVDYDCDVGSAIHSVLQKPGMARAMVLFVFSDARLPFGQLRMRSAFDGENPRLRSAFGALGPENRVTCLHIGAGYSPAGQPLLDAEVGALPRVLANAATAAEIWLSEADLGLVMRFVNRPEVYEMPVGWPYRQKLSDSQAASAGAAPAITAGQESDSDPAGKPDIALESYNIGSLFTGADGDGFALFDLNRSDVTEPPQVALEPLSPQSALLALEERPPACEALRVAGRRFQSIEALEKDLSGLITELRPGKHLRFSDDEEAVKSILAYHPQGDRLMEDLVAVKVDCSPIDDNTRCLWVVKFDGYEEDVSLRACLAGLQRWLELEPESEEKLGMTTRERMGLARWTPGLRQSSFARARRQEWLSKKANV